MKIPRLLLENLKQAITPGKVVVVYGPRQVGKTTLVNDLMPLLPLRSRLISGDELIYREVLSSQDRQRLGELIQDVDLLILDEAQRVENIGLNLKILIDSYPQARLVATGSASFDLANQIREPLTGRSITLTLFPCSFQELEQAFGIFDTKSQLERWLIWGAYPEIAVTESASRRETLLSELVGSYLYRDLLEMDGLKRPEKIVDLLRLLAFQIGQEVSLAELATNLAINRSTVERYLDLLEKVFVIFKVRGFSRNLRKEITKNSRYYFYDNGVRNALIQNFNSLALRNDLGQLWENYLAVERRKANEYSSRRANTYFWRTHDQKEIDYIEEQGGKLFGYEFKWQGKIKKSTQNTFLEAYPGAEIETITRDNFEQFLK